MLPIFREGPGPYALAVAMTAARMGERQLLVGDDGALMAQVALKAGLTGRSLVVVGSEAVAARVQAAAGEAGVLLEVETVVLPALPTPDAPFDLAVIEAGATVLGQLGPDARLTLARAVRAALRLGGRAIVVERQARRLFGLVRTSPAGLDEFRAGGGAVALLEAGGLKPVRLLADREGQRFTEGLRTF